MINPLTLEDTASMEAYEYFDQNIRRLARRDGVIDVYHPGLAGNDVDAVRHAYVSGVFTHEFGETIAFLLGAMRELTDWSLPDNKMDLWNNEVGRRLALIHQTRKELADAIKKAMENGDLIINTSDERPYFGEKLREPSEGDSIIVLKENETGGNEIFFDMHTSMQMTRAEFVAAIEQGNYLGYETRKVRGTVYPASKRDGDPLNNLG